MIDFIFGACAGVGGVLIVNHFKGHLGSVKAGQSPLSFVQTVMEGFKQIMTDVAQNIIGKIDALEASIATKFSGQIADLQTQLDAEKQAHADDLAQITAKLDAALNPPAG